MTDRKTEREANETGSSASEQTREQLLSLVCNSSLKQQPLYLVLILIKKKKVTFIAQMSRGCGEGGGVPCSACQQRRHQPCAGAASHPGTNAAVLAWESPPEHIACQGLRAVCSLQLMQSLLLIQIPRNICQTYIYFFFKLNYGHEVKFGLPDSMAAHVPL